MRLGARREGTWDSSPGGVLVIMSLEMKSTLSLLTLTGMLLAAAGCQNSRGPAGARPDPRLAREENERAYTLINQGKYQEAESVLARALDADVTFGPAHNNMGLLYYERGDFYHAAWEFYHASTLMPYAPDVWNNLGMALEAGMDSKTDPKRYDQAVSEYEKARKLAPDNPEYLANLARAKDKRGDRDEEMKNLLQELAYKDARQGWRDWARMKLFKLNATVGSEAPPPTTAPTAH